MVQYPTLDPVPCQGLDLLHYVLNKSDPILRMGPMGGSSIFHWGGPHIEKARDDRQNVALFALKSWLIGGGHGPVAPPLEAPLVH